MAGLTPQQLQLFQNGHADYIHTFVVEEGLGPIFNKQSCGNCHNHPVGATGNQTVTRFGLAEKDGFDPLDDWGGSLLQSQAIFPDCVEVVPEFKGMETVTSARVTNGMLGYGLVEAIDDGDILAVRECQPPDLQGVAHIVQAFEAPGIDRVGRFGWKAQVPTVLTFSSDASFNEIGLTNRFQLVENDPNGPGNLPDLGNPAHCDDGVPDPDDFTDVNGFDFIDRVTHFQRYLAAPPQTPKSGMSGAAIFSSIGCTMCHTPTFVTKDDPELEDAIRNKTIQPYSDFLLHSMGLNSDFIVQGAGTEYLIKTPPLWGLHMRDPLWHDGRVNDNSFELRVTHAIALHNDNTVFSQGRQSALDFAALSAADQAKVVAFLDSLGKAEFDHNGDNDVTIDDFNQFALCYGPGPYTPDDACAVSDVDQDGDVDSDDFLSMLSVFSFPRRDCNGNGVLDLIDILNGDALDANGNGIPDSCEPTCANDTNGDGIVNFDDVLVVIFGFGDCPADPAPCAGDVNLDHTVNFDDVLEIIFAWGNCP